VFAVRHQSCKIITDVSQCFSAYLISIDTSVMLIGDDITTHHCLVVAEMQGCQVLKWFVGN